MVGALENDRFRNTGIMTFHTKQLPSGRWEIYSGTHLLATVGCQQMVLRIFRRLAKNNNAVDMLSIQPEAREKFAVSEERVSADPWSMEQAS